MIGYLPKTVEVNGREHAIRTDYRDILNIFAAYNDPELNNSEKALVTIECFFCDRIDNEDLGEALNKAIWFMDGGGTLDSCKSSAKKIMDWEQDEQMIFAAVNKAAGTEVRAAEYMHWWTFLSYFSEIGECTLSVILNIRKKKNEGKKLEKYEKEIYSKNKSIIDLKSKYTSEELAEREYWNRLLNGGE